MERRKVKIIVSKSGGNASKGSYNYKLSLPTNWIKSLGLGPEEREIVISLGKDKIIIEKDKGDDDND